MVGRGRWFKSDLFAKAFWRTVAQPGRALPALVNNLLISPRKVVVLSVSTTK